MTNDLTVAAANSMPALCRNMDDYMALSSMLARSQFVPKDFRGNEGDVLAAVLFGRSLGLDPMQALQSIAVVNGKPSIYGDTALAVVRASGLVTSVQESIEGEGDKMVAVCKVTRANGDVVEQRYTVDDAKKAQLWGKSGPWSQYPKRMLQMRARGFALRDAAPDALRGLITREEAQDYPQEPMKNVTPIRSELASPPKPKLYRLVDENGVVEFETDLISEMAGQVAGVAWVDVLAEPNRDMMDELLQAANRAAAQGGAKRIAVQTQVAEAWRAMMDAMPAEEMIDQPEMADA